MEQALHDAEQIDNQLTMAMLRQALGEAYARSGNPRRALDQLNPAVDYYRRTQMHPRLMPALQTMAALYESLGQEATASNIHAEVALIEHALGESTPTPNEPA